MWKMETLIVDNIILFRLGQRLTVTSCDNFIIIQTQNEQQSFSLSTDTFMYNDSTFTFNCFIVGATS